MSGRIVTFYSWKGGVGRTMALANVGVQLARRGYRVLLVDWDLEAPGLERYFLDSGNPVTSIINVEIAGDPSGLLGMLNDDAPMSMGIVDPLSWHSRCHSVKFLEQNKSYLKHSDNMKIVNIDLLGSGFESEEYASSLHSFSWKKLFGKYSSSVERFL